MKKMISLILILILTLSAVSALADPMKNAAMLDALIGVYERNVQGYPATAVLPYSQALSRFPAHLQQLDISPMSAERIWSPAGSA